jgi:hypothetical protein
MATIFPLDPQINDEYQGYRYNGFAWKIIGIRLTEEYLTREEADLLYQPFVSTIYDGGNSEIFIPTQIYDGGLSIVDFVNAIDANAA